MPQISRAKSNSFVFFSHSGCLLPLLLIFNLFFGWLFLKPMVWLGIQVILVAWFLFKSWLFIRRLSISVPSKRSGSIDVEGSIVNESEEKKSIGQ